MLIHLHKQATTVPKVHAEIQASSESASVMAERFGTTEQTVYKWKHRDGIQDRSPTPHKLQTTLMLWTSCSACLQNPGAFLSRCSNSSDWQMKAVDTKLRLVRHINAFSKPIYLSENTNDSVKLKGCCADGRCVGHDDFAFSERIARVA